jgi:hypothetical protein
MKKVAFFTPSLKYLLLGLVALVSVSAQSAIISVSASSTNINVSDTVSIYYDISDLSTAPGDSLSGFSFQTLFDSTALSFTSFSFVDDALGNQLDFDSIDLDTFGFFGEASLFALNTIDVFAVSGNFDDVLDANQASVFRFLTLTFTALNVSTTTSVSIDTLFSEFTLGQASQVIPSFNNSAVNITISNTTPPSQPVPGPNVFWMFIASFVLLYVTKKSHLN